MSDGETPYTFIAMRNDGSSPAVNVEFCHDGADALERAKAWLAEHRSCARVEVWLLGELVAVHPEI